MGFDGLEIRHTSREGSGSVSSATELKEFSLTTLFSYSCNGIRLVVDFRIIGGGLPELLRTTSSFEVASVPKASVPMSAALRGAKKF
jgi:hypothetical protein